MCRLHGPPPRAPLLCSWPRTRPAPPVSPAVLFADGRGGICMRGQPGAPPPTRMGTVSRVFPSPSRDFTTYPHSRACTYNTPPTCNRRTQVPRREFTGWPARERSNLRHNSTFHQVAEVLCQPSVEVASLIGGWSPKQMPRGNIQSANLATPAHTLWNLHVSGNCIIRKEETAEAKIRHNQPVQHQAPPA